MSRPEREPEREPESEPVRTPTRHTRRWVAVIAAAVLVLGGLGGIAWWQLRPAPAATEPALAVPVAISIPDVPDRVKIGVVVTLTSAPGQGSDWAEAAEGAQVAVERLTMGGAQVSLTTADDKGTADGARRAVEQLVGDGVSGIVVASEGSHLSGAVQAAEQAGVSLLLPYESDSSVLGRHTWATGPVDTTVGEALGATMKADAVARPLLIDAGGGTPSGLSPVETLTYTDGDDAAAFVRQVAKRAGSSKADSLVLSGPASIQAVVVQALQGARTELPIYLSPDATSPAFAARLSKAGGSLSADLTTVGPNWGDPAALQSDDDGRAMTAFLTALRLQAADPERKSLLGDRSFATVAGAADVRSHDAVVALVRAAATAGSADLTQVSGALGGLRLEHGSGLAGPALDFGTDGALDPTTVGTLRSSDQDLGLRSADDQAGTGLTWFAAPLTR